MSTNKTRIAVITGGGTGIGRAQAIALSNAGATVIIAGRRKEPLEQVQKEIGSDKCHIMAGIDVGKPDCWKELVEKVQALGGELHFLGNTAGDAGLFGPNHPYESIDPEYLINFNTTYMTSVELSYHFMIPLLAKGAESSGKPSVIVNMGSAASVLNRSNAGQLTSMYNPVKGAIEHITRCAYSLYKEKNILSYGIDPFAYESPMLHRAAAALGWDPQTYACAFNPFPVMGDPAHIGSLCVAWLKGTSEMQSSKHYLIGPLSDNTSIVAPLDQHRATKDSIDPLALTRAWTSITEAYTQDGKRMTEEQLEDFREAIKAKVEKIEKEGEGVND